MQFPSLKIATSWSTVKLLRAGIGSIPSISTSINHSVTASSHYCVNKSKRSDDEWKYRNTTLVHFRRWFQRKFGESIKINEDSDSIINEFELKNDGSLDTGSFSSIGVVPSLCKALSDEGITTPTQVQDRSLPITLSTKTNCIIKSETGSGKTLTFLLPALQEKLVGLSTLIIVPSRELAIQILYQANNLCKNIKNDKRIMAYYAGTFSEETLVEKYAELRPHILISTPKPLLKLLETKLKDFVNIQRVVLDEVDKLLLLPDKKAKMKKKAIRDVHARATNLVVEKLLNQKRKNSPQFIATSATLDQDVEEELRDLGWGDHPKIIRVSEIITDNPLILPSTIQHCYLECDDTSTRKTREHRDKIDALIEHFQSSGDKSALVFIHRGAPITQFVYQLQKRKIRVEALHENVKESNQYSKFLKAFESGEIELVIATEETVRGLDFPWLSTVYVLEVPRTANEYLHLCGRVGRVGRRGRAVVITENPRETRRLESHYKKLGVEGEIA